MSSRYLQAVAVLLLLFFLQISSNAHVGSPNVFFDGKAGAYAIRAVIRPPVAIPGDAQIDVRVENADTVTVQPAFAGATMDAAAPPVPIQRVVGDTGLFNGSFHLFRSGPYAVIVTVKGQAGEGNAIVPLEAAPLRQQKMPPSLAIGLIGTGIVLFVAAFAIAAAAGREYGRSVAAGTVTTLLLAGAVCAGALRWRTMDRNFRANALAQPLPVTASVQTVKDTHLLRLISSASAGPNSSWQTLVADHGKLLHLFLVREPDFDAFAHLHPVRRNSDTFEGVLPPLPPGDYSLYAEATRENGITQTLVAKLILPAPIGQPAQAAMSGEAWCYSPINLAPNADRPFALDADDSWHIGSSSPATASRVSPLMGGKRMVFQNSGPLIADRETTLRFALADGTPLRPYMGMLGHAVIRRSNGSVFTHLHPMGTFSMAAQSLYLDRPPSPASMLPQSQVSEVLFPYAFPQAGNYRIWVQVRTDSRILTGVFDVSVRSADAG